MEAQSEQMQASIETMFFFSQRVVNLWNRLPATVVEASSVNSFKKRLDEWKCGTISFCLHPQLLQVQVQVQVQVLLLQRL